MVPSLTRSVRVFSNDTDQLVEEFPLPEVDVATLRRLWNITDSDSMIHEFEIGLKQMDFFQQLLGIEFNFEKYSYFLSAHQ
jgi:hypothetical protein